MSDRITYNTNSDNFFATKVKETTVAHIQSVASFYTGALPIHAMVELLYRVKSFTIDLTADFDNGGGLATYTASTSLTHNDIANVRELSESLSQLGEGYSNEFGFFTSADPFRAGLLDPAYVIDKVAFYKDENNEFWALLTFYISGVTSNEDGAVTIFMTNEQYLYSDTVANPCNLVLAGGTYPLTDFYVGIDGTTTTASCTITATEWWDYETKAGLPAWDSSTGLASNGGVVS